jgi:hypothetical protein
MVNIGLSSTNYLKKVFGGNPILAPFGVLIYIFTVVRLSF